jgi:tetratricopeptide (TPR) repeat protein
MKPIKTSNQIQKSARSANRYDSFKYRRPFWLPASNYYILAIAVTIAFFVLFMGLFHEPDEDAPWIIAGIGSSVVLIGGVVLREVILRKARNRYMLAQKQLDYNLNSVALHARSNQNLNKLTLEKNASIIREIEKKSEAARVLAKLPEGHMEVFEMCHEYLSINEKELETVGIGSPRLAALRRGKEIVRDLHHFHLLTWAQIESRTLTQEAKNRVTISEKLETAQKALSVLETALQFYPNETQLIESGGALKQFIASIKVSHWIELAERSAFKGNYKRAISHYRDALFFLARENIPIEESEIVAGKINLEITKLREIGEKKEKNNLENG